MGRSKKYIGGKLLGQGLYGCAFTPPLKCTIVEGKEVTSNTVGKITSPEDAIVEYSVSTVLSKLTNADKYFILASSLCVPEPRVKQTDRNLASCGPLLNEVLPNKAELIMPLGGTPLRMVPHTPRSIQYFSFCQHLLEAGALLLIGGVVHNDLHVMNVLCDSPSTSRIIDFGLSWRPSNLTSDNISDTYRVFNPAISQEAPELTYLFSLIDDELVDTPEINLAVIQDKKPTIQLLSKVFGLRPAVQMEGLKEFIETSTAFRTHNWLSFFKLYWTKIDAWAIGTILLSLYVDLSMDPDFEESEIFKRKSKNSLSIIKGLCELDPGKRLDAIEALDLWAPHSAVLEAPDVQGWLQITKQMKQELRKVY